MSPEWRAAVASFNPRPAGRRDALPAVLVWCTATPGDKRAKWIAEAGDSTAGGEAVGRALRAGDWNSEGLDELEAALRNGGRGLVVAFLRTSLPRR